MGFPMMIRPLRAGFATQKHLAPFLFTGVLP
jgi:hypothetical protein